MSNTFPPELIAALSLGAVWPVTMIVNLLKPLIEKIPGLSVSVADKPAHDAAIQLLNGVTSVGFTLILAILGGYVQNPSQAWVMGVQIVGIMLAADFNYRGSAKSSGGVAPSTPLAPTPVKPALATRLVVSPEQVSDALNSAIQQAQGQPNAVKTLADDAPDAVDATQVMTQPALPVVKPATQP